VAAVTNPAITPTIATNADHSQNECVIGRQGIDNVITIDTQARIQDHIAGNNKNITTEHLPILPVYDFCAAFPSVAHEFIFIVLTALKIPQGLFLFLKSLYENIRCVGCFDGVSIIYLYLIQSGIIQGCPASGSVFVLVVDRFLRFLSTISKDATTRAFADDIGSVIPSLNLLPKYYRAFNLFERVSGLGLKAKKCVIIPLGKTLTPELAKEITEYLAKAAPKWVSFNIRGASEYLGFIIGPEGGNDAKTFNNFNSTVSEIANARLPTSSGTALYKLKAFPRLSYIPQLFTPPAKTARIEKYAILTNLHVPHNSLPKDTPYCLDKIGMKSFTPIKLMAESTCARAALKSQPSLE
jgi:hypothetical protein